MVQSTSKLSPGEALRQKKAEHRQGLAFHHLAQSLQRGEIVGDDVTRLHAAITESAGDTDKLSLVETDLALRHFLALNRRVAMDDLRPLR